MLVWVVYYTIKLNYTYYGCSSNLRKSQVFFASGSPGAGLETERFEALRSQVKRPLYGCDCPLGALGTTGYQLAACED